LYTGLNAPNPSGPSTLASSCSYTAFSLSSDSITSFNFTLSGVFSSRAFSFCHCSFLTIAVSSAKRGSSKTSTTTVTPWVLGCATIC
jgi:hypothetical protein